jgi:hypothetical protein
MQYGAVFCVVLTQILARIEAIKKDQESSGV